MRILFWILLLGHTAFAQAQPAEKADLDPTEFKAAFLSKIPPYVTWPDSDSQLVIGILGGDPAENLLRELFKDRKVKGREIVIKVFPSESAVGKCHVLFVPASQQARWQELNKKLDPVGLLSVGENDDFINSGGVFNLAMETRKLEISLSNAKKARLEINSKLLKIGTLKK